MTKYGQNRVMNSFTFPHFPQPVKFIMFPDHIYAYRTCGIVH